MGRSKTKAETTRWAAWSGSWPGVVVRFLLRPGVIVHGIFVMAILVAIYLAWQTWGPVVQSDRRYQITLDSVNVTPQPEWIRCDVKAEVMDANGLIHQSALDPQITVTVARAFSVHSWVAQVTRVRKSYPAQIVVELEYRRPVGMVIVPRDDGKPGVIPVDENGIVLPTEDFKKNETDSPQLNYLRIDVGETRHDGPTGTAWGDDRVVGAAQVARLVESVWQAAGLYRIELAAESTGRRADDLMFELVTKDDRRFLWGHSPGNERPGELSPAEKIKLLETAAKSGELRFDLRQSPSSARKTTKPAERVPASTR